MPLSWRLVKILLISTYELGHQPLHVASPAAALLGAGHEVRANDVSIDPLDWDAVAWADGIGISVPMHTAMRLGVDVAERIRQRLPDIQICLYGLYASVGRDRTAGVVADRIIAGEYETALVEWAGTFDTGVTTELAKTSYELPARHLLPNLDRYAHLEHADGHRLVGYVEATHGCRHRCGHCPIPAIYDGLFRLVSTDVVLDDIGQLVAMGAEHITFGDPDFFNGPRHAMRLLEASHERFPHLTYDITVKVEHILNHRELWPRVGELGVIFAVSAFESTNDYILELLDKGHTAADMPVAIEIMRAAGIDIRPSWMPFTPWTTTGDIVDMFRFVAAHEIDTDPIQFTIRLLIPEDSVLLKRPELGGMLGDYHPDRLTYEWAALDATTDDLAAGFVQVVERSTRSNAPARSVTNELWAMALDADGKPLESLEMGSFEGRPRLSEPWFC